MTSSDLTKIEECLPAYKELFIKTVFSGPCVKQIQLVLHFQKYMFYSKKRSPIF